MNRSMAAKHLKAKKCAMADFLANDNHRVAGGSWKTPHLEWLCNHKPFSVGNDANCASFNVKK